MSQQKYEYYGFISYNRHDRKWAQMLQKQLERYPLPASLRKERPDIPKHITPIFLDQSDLVSHDEGLEQALLDKLDASAYLIVLCSPNSAHSSWVDAEIRHFIETGRLKRIIPVVISGESHAADPEKECYPPALRDLTGSDKLLSIRVENHGKNGVILRLAATILGLRMDDLITRDAAYRKRRRLAFTFAAMIMAAVIAAAVWYNTPHSAYYRDVIFRWEIPTGIGRVSAEERKSQYYTYRLTTLQNRVIRMERVNSVGIPVTGYSFMNYGSTPVVQYIYENNGKLSRAEYYDAYERPLYEVSYSPDLRILDFVHFDSGYSYSLTSGTDSLQFRPEKSAIENHNDVIRYVQDYDGDGLLIRRMFKRDNRGSSGGTPVRNSSGVWGEAYSYDISGRPVSSCGINQDGMIMAGVDGIACQKYSYDEKGRQESQTLTDKDGNTTAKNGTASVRFSYDENNRIDRTNYYNTEGDLFSRTASSVSFEYDAHGFLTGIGYFDSQNAPLYVDGYNSIRFTNDPQGHPLRQQFLDAEGKAVCLNSGYAEVVFQYDAQGRTAEYHYLGRDGSPAINTEIRAAGIRNIWADGFLTGIDYLDTEGQRTIGNNGFASIRYTYNSERQLEREWYLDVLDQPVRCGSGFAAQAFTYTNGNVTGWTYEDENGEPCTDSTGTANTVYTYEGGLRTSTAYFGAEGEPVLRSGYYHREEASYDDFGQLLGLSWFGTDGSRVNNEDNYSSVCYTYDEFGRIITETYFDINGLETTLRGFYDASRLQYEYNAEGNIVRVFYQSDLTRPDDLASECVSEYDSRGNLTASRWLNASGMPVRNENGFTEIRTFFNDIGQMTERRFYTDESDLFDSELYTYNDLGHLIAVMSSGAGYAIRAEYTYDEFGNLTGEQYSDPDGNLTDPGKGYARIENSYDAFGNKTDIRWFNAENRPVVYDGTGAHHVMSYNSFGRCVSTEYYDEADQPTETGGFFRWTRTYNTYGWPAEESRYDTEGRYLGKIVWVYTPAGTVENIRHYDMNGEEVRAYVHIPVITGVMQDNPASEAGIETGDVLMQYGNWTFDQVFTDPENWQSGLQMEVAAGRENQKRITALYTADGSRDPYGPVPGFGFVDKVFPPGLVGIEMGGIDIPADTYEFLLNIWQQYLAADLR